MCYNVYRMKQLYTIGILVAVVLLVLLGLSKLSNRPAEPAPAVESTPAADVQDEQPNDTAPMSDATGENTMVVMQTSMGDITIELFTKDMPITAGNFLKLVNEDYYDGIKFHRVINGFMIQGGDPLTKDESMASRWGTGGPGYTIEDEFVPGYSNVRGTLSMANAGPNSGGSQFFINLVDNTNLDYDKNPPQSKHPVFGRVTEGMDVVDAIGSVATGARDVPSEPVVINDIVVQ
jgi:peptidylprolyl isomerase